MKKTTSLIFSQTTEIIVIWLGAVGSLYFVIRAGSNNSSILLRALFVIWVLSPFVAFFIAHSNFKFWSSPTRKSVYWLIVIVVVGSLIAYSGAFKTPKTKNAFIFLIVPLFSWLLLIGTILIGKRLSQGAKTKA